MQAADFQHLHLDRKRVWQATLLLYDLAHRLRIRLLPLIASVQFGKLLTARCALRREHGQLTGRADLA